MKVSLKNPMRKFLVGGAMEAGAPEEQPVENQEAPAEAPAEGSLEGQDPMVMLIQMSAQALQNQDCQMAMQVCQAFVLIAQQMQGQEQQPQGEPVFRKGGILVRRIRK